MQNAESAIRPLPALRSVSVGKWQNDRGEWEERTLALPANLPPERRALAVRAAAWADPTILHWLLGLPVYSGTVLVALTPSNVIHRIQDGTAFACGNTADRNLGGRTLYLPLSEALAVAVDEHGERHRPEPCRTCFATGLLVATE